MARKITDVQNTNGINAVYPSGSMRDKAGATSGTILEEELIGDMTQFFAKLMRDTSTVENSTPDNEINGYQLVTAFIAYVRLLTATTTSPGVVEKSTEAERIAGTADKFIDALLLKASQTDGDWQTPAYLNNFFAYTTGNYAGLRYRLLANGMLHIYGSVGRISDPGADIVFNLPAGFRPVQDIDVAAGVTNADSINVNIDTSGNVSVIFSSTGEGVTINEIIPLN